MNTSNSESNDSESSSTNNDKPMLAADDLNYEIMIAVAISNSPGQAAILKFIFKYLQKHFEASYGRPIKSETIAAILRRKASFVKVVNYEKDTRFKYRISDEFKLVNNQYLVRRHPPLPDGFFDFLFNTPANSPPSLSPSRESSNARRVANLAPIPVKLPSIGTFLPLLSRSRPEGNGSFGESSRTWR